jgi:hypothetical protein
MHLPIGMRAQGNTLPRPVSTGSGNPLNSDSADFTRVIDLAPGVLVTEQ